MGSGTLKGGGSRGVSIAGAATARGGGAVSARRFGPRTGRPGSAAAGRETSGPSAVICYVIGRRPTCRPCANGKARLSSIVVVRGVPNGTKRDRTELAGHGHCTELAGHDGRGGRAKRVELCGPTTRRPCMGGPRPTASSP